MHFTEKEGFAWPIKLRVLVLTGNSLGNNTLPSLSGLQYLKSLDLSGNQLEGSLNISGQFSYGLFVACQPFPFCGAF